MHSALCIDVLAFAHLALAGISPTFWHDVIGQTPVRVITAAGSVAVLVQLVKKYAPNAIQGRVTLAVNFVLSLAAVFVGMRPADFWSETTLAQVIAVFFMASGTHGVGKGLFDLAPADPTEKVEGGGGGVQAATKLALLLVMLGAAAGCAHQPQTTVIPTLPAGAADQTDAQANRILQSIQGFMQPIVRDIGNGKLKLAAGQRQVVDQLDLYYNKAATAEQIYHLCMTVTPAVAVGAPTQPPDAAVCLTRSALTGALANAQSEFSTAQTALASSIKP